MSAVLAAVALRPSTPADLEFDRLVFAQSRPELAFLPEHILLQQFAAHAGQHADATRWVIVEDDEAVGRVLVRESSAEFRIVDIAVLESHRGRGIGSSILAQLTERAHTLGVPLTLSVRPENNRARALYARLGFTELASSETRIELALEGM